MSACLLLSSSCASRKAPCLDAPSGTTPLLIDALEALDANSLEAAGGNVARALRCDPTLGMALSVRALVRAGHAARARDPLVRDELAKGAKEDLRAIEADRGVGDRMLFEAINAIRAYTWLQEVGSLESAQRWFDTARRGDLGASPIPYYGESEALSYFMAEAFVVAGEFDKARDLYAQVLARRRNGRWGLLADAAWAHADEMVRTRAAASPDGVSRRVASSASVSRGDLCALLVEEVGLGALGRRSKGGRARGMPGVPLDIGDTEYRSSIMTMLALDVRGLELVYDHARAAYLFHPDEPVPRKVFAMAVQDLLARVSAEPDLMRANFGQETSLFADVEPTAAWYGACATMVARGFMASDSHGAFRPDEPVSGSEALLVARRLRQAMSSGE